MSFSSRTSFYGPNALNRYPLLSWDEEKDLIQQWKKLQDSDALSKLLNSHLRLVFSVARKLKRYTYDYEDLISIGIEGLLKAIQKFDPSRNVRLSSYAVKWIMFYMKDHIFENQSLLTPLGKAKKSQFFKLAFLKAKYSQEELSPEFIGEKLGISPHDAQALLIEFSPPYSLDMAFEDAHGFYETLPYPEDNQEAQVIQSDIYEKRKALLMEAMKMLTPQEHRIFRKRLLADPPLTLKEVSEKTGFSLERVRQIENSALVKVKKRISMLQYRLPQQPSIIFH